jgi:hypothetical protein
MRKTVTLNLEIDTDFESTIYDAVGSLLANIEDSDFTINNVTVVDSPKINISLPALRGEEVTQAVKRNYRSGY